MKAKKEEAKEPQWEIKDEVSRLKIQNYMLQLEKANLIRTAIEREFVSLVEQIRTAQNVPVGSTLDTQVFKFRKANVNGPQIRQG